MASPHWGYRKVSEILFLCYQFPLLIKKLMSHPNPKAENYQDFNPKYMSKLYKVNILIFNEHGELLDKQLAFPSLDEMGSKLQDNIFQLVEEARTNGHNDGMLYEELFDSKEEAELMF